MTSGSEINSYPLAATAGEPKTIASDLHSESGVEWKGGRFGQGAATAGEVRLRNFRKRPDQQREGSKSKTKSTFSQKPITTFDR